MVDRLARTVELVLALALICAVLLNFVNVIGRYGFGRSFLAADEVQTYVMVYMAFLGAAVASWRGLHLRMDVLAQRLPAPVRSVLSRLELLLVVLLGGLVTWVAWQYVAQMYSLGAKSQTAQIPMWIPHLALVLGFGLMVILTALRKGEMTFALAVVPITLLLLGFPIFLVLLAASSVALVFFMKVPLAVLHQNLFGAIDAYALLAVPFFIYAGELMGRGTVAQRLVDFVQSGVGAVRGSLAVTTVGTSAIFGAISGASAATVATVGRVMLPALRKDGYPEKFSAGLITSVGAIDIIIPPSIPMIVYGAAAQESVPRLYAAGVLPGLLIAGLLALYVVWYARRNAIGSTSLFSLNGFLRAAGRGAWALGAPVIILGGIYGGIFSPTEAAAVACMYSALVTALVYRDIGWRDIVASAGTTVVFSAQILVIVACASVFAWLLTVNQVPAAMARWIQQVGVSPWELLLAINVLLLVVGCFLDPLSAILLLTPLMVPIVKAAGIDGVHFGVVVMVNLAIGLFHPPFGLNIFVAQSVLKLPLGVIYRGIVPFLFIYLFALGLITYIPEISLYGMRLLLNR